MEYILKPSTIFSRYDKLDSDRQNFRHTWQDIADYVHPTRNDINNSYSSGEKRRTHLLDNTGIVNKELLAANLHSMLTNPNTNWLQFTTGNRDLDREVVVNRWLERQSEVTIEILNASNFQTEIFSFYEDLAGLCTAGLWIDEDDEMIVRFLTLHINSFVIRENHKGFVDEAYRKFKWTARNIVGEFGEEKALVIPMIKEAFEKNSEQEFEIIHAVYPNMDPKRQESKFDFISQYAIKDHVSNNEPFEIDRSGYYEKPCIVSRWKKLAGEMYGRGPGWTALPEMKILNEMTKTTIKGAQKTVDPPVQMTDDGVVLPLKLIPGGVNFRRPGSDPITPIFDNYRVDFGIQAMDGHRMRIKEAFYTDRLTLPDRDRMTAEEVNTHQENNGRLLGPLMGRQEVEFLTPTIDRVYGIIERKGLYERPPSEVVEYFKKQKKSFVELKTRYKSFLSRSQKASELNKYSRAFEFINAMAQLRPSVLDNIDEDALLLDVLGLQEISPRVIRSPEERDEMREAAAEQAQKQQQQADELQQAEVANKVAPLVK